MAVVALIPTGKLEHAALPRAMKKLFPDHDFVSWPPETHLDGFTSVDVKRLVLAQPGPVPTNLDELAAGMVNAMFPGRKDRRFDFAYVVEDLELCDQGQPELVLRLFRDTVSSYISRTWPQQSGGRYEQVRERCSFHLFRPMTETYFFGDRDALTRAGAVQPPELPADIDVEQFRTIDQAYLSLPAWRDLVANKPERDRIAHMRNKRIVDMPEREFHPKSYLNYLCDPTLADRSKRYKESHNGVAALESLNWQSVVSNAPHCPFLHAFLDDLAEALNTPLTFIDRFGADERARLPGPIDRILRNL